jgi:hypothetical protein
MAAAGDLTSIFFGKIPGGTNDRNGGMGGIGRKKLRETKFPLARLVDSAILVGTEGCRFGTGVPYASNQIQNPRPWHSNQKRI